MSIISFNIPFTTKESAENISKLINAPDSINVREYTHQCKKWFESNYPGYTAYMTTTCTHAIELAAKVIEFEPGDEVIMQSFNYVGVANSFVNAGAKVVFVDIDPVTMNIDPDKIKAAITNRTRAVVVMHYGGVACDIMNIKAICDKNQLFLIEDNAQGIGASSKDGILGSFGDFSCISFDKLKIISSNQGGVLLCKNKLAGETDICYENGTNRTAFFSGKLASYSWVNQGSNYAISEYDSALLLPLLKQSSQIVDHRRKLWLNYQQLFNEKLPNREMNSITEKRPLHNGHIFYIKLKDSETRLRIIEQLRAAGIIALFHYTPLHSSEAGMRFGRFHGEDIFTTAESSRILRLPMHNYLTPEDQIQVIETLVQAIHSSEDLASN